MERQPQVNSLREISDALLIKGHGEDYIEAEEKVHVIEKKLRRLLEQVSHDLMSLQGSQVSPRAAFKYKRCRNRCTPKAASSRGSGASSHNALQPCGLKTLHPLFKVLYRL